MPFSYPFAYYQCISVTLQRTQEKFPLLPQRHLMYTYRKTKFNMKNLENLLKQQVAYILYTICLIVCNIYELEN